MYQHQCWLVQKFNTFKLANPFGQFCNRLHFTIIISYGVSFFLLSKVKLNFKKLTVCRSTRLLKIEVIAKKGKSIFIYCFLERTNSGSITRFAHDKKCLALNIIQIMARRATVVQTFSFRLSVNQFDHFEKIIHIV